MSVERVSSGMNAFMEYWRSQIQRGRQDFRQLSNALQSGDLAAAQQAFTDLQAVTPGFGPPAEPASSPDAAAAAANGASNSSASTTAPADPREVVKSDVAALGTALQSGDLAGAKTAFAKLQQDMQSLKDAHHPHKHHHARGGPGATGIASNAPAQGSISTTPPAATAASSVKDADGDHDGTKTFYGVDLKA